MSLVCIGLGTATLGRTTKNAEGKVISSTPAQWTEDQKGGCVMVGKMNPETMEIDPDSISLHSRMDSVSYLEAVRDLLLPENVKPFTDMPDLREIVQKATSDGVNFCDYCSGGPVCVNCAIRAWADEA